MSGEHEDEQRGNGKRGENNNIEPELNLTDQSLLQEQPERADVHSIQGDVGQGSSCKHLMQGRNGRGRQFRRRSEEVIHLARGTFVVALRSEREKVASIREAGPRDPGGDAEVDAAGRELVRAAWIIVLR